MAIPVLSEQIWTSLTALAAMTESSSQENILTSLDVVALRVGIGCI